MANYQGDLQCNFITGAWTSPSSGVYESVNTTSGIKVRVTTSAPAFWSGTSTTAYSQTVDGTCGLTTSTTTNVNTNPALTLLSGNTATSGNLKIEFFDAAGNLVNMTNPKIDITQIGGAAGVPPNALQINGSQWTLASGGSLTKLSGTTNLAVVNGNTFKHADIGMGVGGTTTMVTCNTGNAGGTMSVNNTGSTILFNITNLGIDGNPSTNADQFQLMVEYTLTTPPQTQQVQVRTQLLFVRVIAVL